MRLHRHEMENSFRELLHTASENSTVTQNADLDEHPTQSVSSLIAFSHMPDMLKFSH